MEAREVTEQVKWRKHPTEPHAYFVEVDGAEYLVRRAGEWWLPFERSNNDNAEWKRMYTPGGAYLDANLRRHIPDAIRWAIRERESRRERAAREAEQRAAHDQEMRNALARAPLEAWLSRRDELTAERAELVQQLDRVDAELRRVSAVCDFAKQQEASNA